MAKNIDNKDKKITLEQSKNIIHEISNKYYGSTKELSNSQQNFLKEFEKPKKARVINLTKKNNKKQNIIKFSKEVLGKEITEAETEVFLNRDDKHRTKLSIDQYLTELRQQLHETKTYYTSSGKPMSSPKAQTAFENSPSESLITARIEHQEQVSNLAGIMAERLGCNRELAEAGAEHHDDGHTSSGHTGERIAGVIARYYNIGINWLHNARSADLMVNEENLIQRMLKIVRSHEGEISKEREQEVINDCWTIIDIPISHNGEGVDRIKYYNPDKKMEDIINDKNNCFTELGYDKKIVPKTKEGAIVAWADIICYVCSDLKDGKRMGILKAFNDDYLRYIGILVSKTKNPSLYRLSQNIFKKEDELESTLQQMQNKLKDAGIELNRPEEIGEETFEKIRKNTDINPKDYIDVMEKYINIQGMAVDVLKATTEVGREYIDEIPRHKRVSTVSELIKKSCMEDLVQSSYNKDYVVMSPAILKVLYGIRNENLSQIVQFSRRKFEKEQLPYAEFRVHADLKKALEETGLIREYMNKNKNIDGNTNEMFELTPAEEAARRKYGLTNEVEIRIKEENNKTDKILDTRIQEDRNASNTTKIYRYERKVCHYFINLFNDHPERIKEIYMNSLNAGESVAKYDVEKALENKKPEKNEILGEEYYKKILEVKDEIDELYPNRMNLYQKHDFISQLIHRRRNNKVELMSSAIALEYVSGMTDETIIEASKLKGYLTNKIIEDGYKREGNPEKQLQEMQATWNKKAESNYEILNKMKRILEEENKKSVDDNYGESR